jgi:hypothetical protein
VRQRQGCDDRCDRSPRLDLAANRLQLLGFDLARLLNNRLLMNRLETIANRQRKNRLRDVMFAAVVGLAAIIGATTVGTACAVASTHVAQH